MQTPRNPYNKTYYIKFQYKYYNIIITNIITKLLISYENKTTS